MIYCPTGCEFMFSGKCAKCSTMAPPLRLSVIIPARNAAHYLVHTLPAMVGALPDGCEMIVVDDCSTDDSVGVAEQHGAIVIRLEAAQGLGPGKGRGASAARNAGVQAARGDVVAFVDADVKVHQNTLEMLLDSLQTRPEIDAVFGSYDDDPADRHTVSTFKNLMHHYIHQQGNAEASTFWTGCGAVRRHVFKEIGPFHQESHVCAEDIDYGHRLCDGGHKIWLRRDIQCKHLKRWTLWRMARTDVMQRGIPWTVMMLRRGRADGDLNLGWRHRGSAALAGGAAIALVGAGIWQPVALPGAAFCIAGLVWLQRGFYAFLAARRGWWFAVRCAPLHVLYYCYSILAVVAGVVVQLFSEGQRGFPA